MRTKNISKIASAAMVMAVVSTAAFGGQTNAIYSDSSSHPMVTISLSGSTALRNFINNAGAKTLEPLNGVAQTITFSNGTYSSGTSNGLLLAPSSVPTANLSGASGATSTGPGLQVEWHEQGSVEGILELAQDQVGFNYSSFGSTVPRNPTSGNPIRINQNNFTTGGSQGSNGANAGYTLSNTYTYGSATSQSPVQIALSDVNVVQGFSVAGTASWQATPGSAGYGKGNPAFSSVPVLAGTVATTSKAFPLVDQTNLNNASLGLTQGTSNLTSTAFVKTATVFTANPGTGLVRVNETDTQWLQMTGRLQNGVNFNMTTRDVNSGTRNVAAVNTGVDPSFAVGENDAGNGNATTGATDQISIGYGMTYSNKTAGGGELRPTVVNNRMAVGTLSLPDYRGASTSTAPIRALDITTAAVDPTSFNYKTQQSYDPLNPYYDANFVASNTAATNASGVAIGSNGSVASSINPAVTVSGQWVRVSAKNIVTGAYPLTQNEQMVTFNDNSRTAPTSFGSIATQGPAILGDPNNDALALKSMILDSASQVGSGSITGPAVTALQQGYLPTQLASAQRTLDGQAFSANTTTVSSNLNLALSFQGGNLNSTTGQGDGGGKPDSPASSTFLVDSTAAGFSVTAPSAVTSGSGAKYGGNGLPASTINSAAGVAYVAPNVALNSNNWFFGNFNQNGIRDFSAVKSGLNAALAMVGDNDAFIRNASGVPTAQAATSNTFTFSKASGGTLTMSKGDLIVMGDFNGDGKFDGQDILMMSKGAAVADSASGDTLTATSVMTDGGLSFGDALRNNAVLRKNGALDYVQGATSNYATNSASYAIRLSAVNNVAASVPYAFDKADVNGDGTVDAKDIAIVKKFVGQSFMNIDNNNAAVISGSTGGATPTSLSDAVAFDLTNAKLIDGISPGATMAGVITNADVSQVYISLVAHGTLKAGDISGAISYTAGVTADGLINVDDYLTIDSNFTKGLTNPLYTDGDLNGDGTINSADYAIIDSAYISGPNSAGSISALYNERLGEFGQGYVNTVFGAVPEPTSLSLLAIGAAGLLARRRK